MLVVEQGDGGYDSAVSCGDTAMIERLNIAATDRCTPFATQDFMSCQAIAPGNPGARRTFTRAHPLLCTFTVHAGGVLDLVLVRVPESVVTVCASRAWFRFFSL